MILGQFTGCSPPSPGGVTEEHGRELLHGWVRSLGVPALGGFPHGHEALAGALPFARPARLETDPPALHLLGEVTAVCRDRGDRHRCHPACPHGA